MRHDLRESLRTLLREVAYGPAGESGAFSEAGAGLLPALESASAAEASLPVAPGRPSLAAFTAHLTADLSAVAGAMAGQAEQRDPGAAWQVSAVDDAAWSGMREELRQAFGRVEKAMSGQGELPGERVDLLLATLTHTAYHAGGIRITLLNHRASTAITRRGS